MPRLVKLSHGYCIKPETSEYNKSISMRYCKSAKFSTLRSYYWAMLKNRYFRPCGYEGLFKRKLKLTLSSCNLLWTPATKQVAREQFSKVSRRTRLATGVQLHRLTLDFLPRMQSLCLQTTFLATHRRFL